MRLTVHATDALTRLLPAPVASFRTARDERLFVPRISPVTVGVRS